MKPIKRRRKRKTPKGKPFDLIVEVEAAAAHRLGIEADEPIRFGANDIGVRFLRAMLAAIDGMVADDDR